MVPHLLAEQPLRSAGKQATVHGYYWDDNQPMMYFQDVPPPPNSAWVAAAITGFMPYPWAA